MSLTGLYEKNEIGRWVYVSEGLSVSFRVRKPSIYPFLYCLTNTQCMRVNREEK